MTSSFLATSSSTRRFLAGDEEEEDDEDDDESGDDDDTLEVEKGDGEWSLSLSLLIASVCISEYLRRVAGNKFKFCCWLCCKRCNNKDGC